MFLESAACLTKAWFIAHETESSPLSAYDQFIIDEGIEIHNRAHTLFPKGVLVAGGNKTAAQQTAKLLKDPSVSTLFEATFVISGGVTRADIIKKTPTGWHLLEVKSGLDPQKEYIDDLSYTTMICIQAGLPIKRCSLLLLSRDYQYGEPAHSLFKEYDCTEQVLNQAIEFWEWYKQQNDLVLSGAKPHPEFKWECKGCEYLENCFKELPAYSVFDLPRLHHTKFCQLRDMGVTHISKIPEDFPLTPAQINVRKSITTSKPFVDQKGLKKKLGNMRYPLYFLDFETVITALPIYPKTSPHTQIPTQFSLHVVSDSGDIIQHHEYLADPKKDCRRELAERLITHCEDQGTILTYSSFEKIIISKLSELFPDISQELQGLLRRLVDLCQIVKDCYYHPDFHGSYSIKNVLPVVVPDLSYDNMEIGNGGDAVVHYASMARGKYTPAKEKQIKKHLLEYCKLDTLAMVRLYRCLKNAI